MKKLLIVLVLTFCFQSCVINQDTVKSKKDVTNTNAEYIKEALVKDGYEPGIVKVIENSDCRFIIHNETSNAKLDPINFNISDFEEFRQEDLKIYFKFRPLNIMSRCKEATPIELLSVVKK